MDNPTVVMMVGSLLGYFLAFRPLSKAQAQRDRDLRHHEILKKTAKDEHELGWLPHGDFDVHQACDICKLKEFGWKPKSEWSSTVLTPNEQRSMQSQNNRGVRYTSSKQSTERSS